jgi:AbrB family looped-hinge helix DNA binding protein
MEPTAVTTLTERGQASIPAALRKALNLKAGQQLLWQQVSDHEFRVEVLLETDVPGPQAMLGYARRFLPDETRSADAVLQELREGDAD